MASYAMAHLKLDMLLTETGFKATKDQRLRVYLTNSLEEYHPETGTIFASWLSGEANEANQIKRDAPVMAVIGNPPYSVSSVNKSKWILDLIEDYKKDLNERKINLDDDYIKFIRYGHYLIDKNGTGILAYISNNSFIDGITHRNMRRKLLSSFNKVYIIDLHGSAKKNEVSKDGTKDENVFDIQQGVSINIFVKSLNKMSENSIFHFDLFGTRESKYSFLISSRLSNINWKFLNPKPPYYFLVPKDFSADNEYKKGFSLSELFILSGSGVKNERDNICKQFTKAEIINVINDFKSLSVDEIRSKYKVNDTRDWKVESAINDVKNDYHESKYILNEYRPFDHRYTYYTGTTRGFIGTPGSKRMYHLINKDNISLLSCRQQSTFDFQHIFLTKYISDICVLSSQTKETGYVFPLYLYPEESNQKELLKSERKPNLDLRIIENISRIIKTKYEFEKSNEEKHFAPIDIFDFIYAILHSPMYRQKYKEFLKIDFPRIPYPKDLNTFQYLVKVGFELRKTHLFESPAFNKLISKYPINGSNKVDKIKYDPENVWINDTQYFSGVPEIAWNFYIGGYQPAQKWLKDRKGRVLSYEDIQHYQKIIVALVETDRIMKEIDKIDFL